MSLNRRSLMACVAGGLATPYVWIPRIAIAAADRRGGLVESVQVYSNLTQLSSLSRYAPDLPVAQTTAKIQNSSIIASTRTLAARGYTKNSESGCELRGDGAVGRLTYLAFQESYREGCLPFYTSKYSSIKYATTVQGPNVVCLSVVAEKIYTERRSKDLCRDLLYPDSASAESTVTFDGCNVASIEDRLFCPLGVVVLKYNCRQATALATIYAKENEAKVYEITVEYKV